MIAREQPKSDIILTLKDYMIDRLATIEDDGKSKLKYPPKKKVNEANC